MSTPATSPSATPTPKPHEPATPVMAATSTAIVGLQWGDEGKGKIVNLLTDRHDAIVRYNGGANAGHSVVVKGERFALHLIPSGIMHADKPAIVGPGVVIDPEWLLKEVAGLRNRGVSCENLVISDHAHVVMPWHKLEDELREAFLSANSVEPIGTTRRGIGPCYADKAQRSTAIRVADLLRPKVLSQKLATIVPFKNAVLAAIARPGSTFVPYDHRTQLEQFAALGEQLRPFVTGASKLLLDMAHSGKSILFEGANATLLDVDHGTYPFVTSSTCSALGVPAGAGVPFTCVRSILGVMKAYSTRVGGGVMPTELINSDADRAIADGIRQRGREFGTTTGRPRRVGWLDLVAVRYSARLNGVHGLCLMLLDVLAGVDTLMVADRYEVDGSPTNTFVPDAHWLAGARPIYRSFPGFSADITAARTLGELPTQARTYMEFIEQTIGVPIRFVSVGPDRAQTIEC
ncbi:MAG: adenylosuccinate synthase [Phycisphaerales bacterium]|jgi:adenylosuccinate synthase